MKQKILNHFKQNDLKLYAAIGNHAWLEVIEPVPTQYYFRNLCRTIVGQQLSGKAARSIWKRFEELFPNKRVTANYILTLSDTKLRGAGMSYAKVNSIKDLAEKVRTKEVRLARLADKTFEEVHDELIQVKGVGPWTIEMFSMFSLAHPDVFSKGDLGLIKGMQKVYGLKSKPTEIQIARFTKKWSPYKTYASLILWRQVD